MRPHRGNPVCILELSTVTQNPVLMTIIDMLGAISYSTRMNALHVLGGYPVIWTWFKKCCRNADDLSITWPDGFKMGYMETRKEMVDGQLFAETYAEYPFNQPPKITANSNYTNLQLYPAYESPPFPLDYDYLGLN